jgi:hypothetical protein
MVPQHDPWSPSGTFGFPRKDSPAFQREWETLNSSGVLIDAASQIIAKPASSVGKSAVAAVGAIKIMGRPAEEEKITITDAGGDTSGFWFTNLHSTGDAKSAGNMWVASASTTTANVDNLITAITAAANLDTTAEEPTQASQLPESRRNMEQNLADWIILTQGTAGAAGNTTITTTGGSQGNYSFGSDGLEPGAPDRINSGTLYLWGLAFVCDQDSAGSVRVHDDADTETYCVAVASRQGPFFLSLPTPLEVTENSGLQVTTLSAKVNMWCTPLYTTSTKKYEG